MKTTGNNTKGNVMVVDNTFQDLEHFFTYIVREIFNTKNVIGEIEEIDYTSDQYSTIYIKMEDTSELSIRLWSTLVTRETVTIDYSLYHEIV